MKEVTITIDESIIKERIFMQSGYTAMARSKAGLPGQFTDIMQATDDEDDMVKHFISDSINEVAGVINRYLAPGSTKFIENGNERERTMYISFTLPHNCPESIMATLKECIISFAAARSLQHWNLIVKPDESNIHIAKAQNELVRMRELLSTRTRPEKGNGEGYGIIEL